MAAALVGNPPAPASGNENDVDTEIDELRAELSQEAGGRITVAEDVDNERITLVGAQAGTALSPASDDAPSEIAREFLDDYGMMLTGDSDPERDLVEERRDAGLDGSTVVKFEERIDDVPVLASQIAVQLDSEGRVLSANGETSGAAAAELATTPGIDNATAAGTAVAATSKHEAIDPALLSAAPPELTIYDPTLIGAPSAGGTRLVWRVDVRTAIGDVEHMVLVDAHTGVIALDVSTRANLLERWVCDDNNPLAFQSCTFASAARREGEPPVAVADVNNAYDLAGVTYDFYLDVLGRDSIDGAGLPIVSTVRYCFTAGCPVYANAFWNGDQMVYGAGYADADDVVAHELTHGVTQYTSDLFYYGESGAINESMSDVFGELIDQWNGPDPAGDKWKIAEELPIGALRNMANPPAFSDPDRMRSNLFTGSPLDSHGVHQNSGVGNKAAFLITDGGVFNGQAITGLGVVKTAKIYYQAQTTLLTPGADYLDLFNVLQQACTNLIAVAITTASDCQQVAKALTATEMNLAPVTVGSRLTAPECSGGTVRGATIFSDDMESGAGKWSVSAKPSSTAWQMTSDSSQSGTMSFHGPNLDKPSLTTARFQNSIAIPAGTTYLRFDHSFNLEGNTSGTVFYDGGVVEFSMTGEVGPWIDAEQLDMLNGYNGQLQPPPPPKGTGSSENPLAGRRAFSDTSAGYQTTRVDLSPLAGQTNVMIRFSVGTDQFVGTDGWFIDDVAVYSCGVNALPSAPASVTASPLAGSALVSWTPPGSIGFPPLSSYVVTPHVNGVAQSPIDTGGTSTTLVVPGLTNGSSYTFTVAAKSSLGTGPASAASNAIVPTGGSFTAVGPARVADTRPGESPNALRAVPKTRIGGDTLLEVNVTDLAGITPPTGVAAVSLNVTATNTQANGFVTIYPCGNRTLVSNINHTTNDTIANAVITPISPTGNICVYANTTTDIIIDINGWFSTNPGFTAVGPARVADTRPGESPNALRAVPKTRIGGDTLLEVNVTDLAGITPPTGVAAVSLNVTATNTQANGFVTIYPCGNRTLVSNINHTTNDTIANAVITPISPTGNICVYANTTTDIIIDINGWFSTNPGFTAVGPARVADTRPGESPNALRAVPKTRIGGDTLLEVNVTDLAGITPPTGVAAVSLNVTATNTQANGFVTIYPCGNRTLVSNINHTTNDTIANAVITPISPTGNICVYANTTTDIIIDINGWFSG